MPDAGGTKWRSALPMRSPRFALISASRARSCCATSQYCKQCLLHSFLAQTLGYIDRLLREGIQPGHVHAGGHAHGGWDEVLHLPGPQPTFLQVERELDHGVGRRARVAADVIGNEVLVLAALLACAGEHLVQSARSFRRRASSFCRARLRRRVRARPRAARPCGAWQALRRTQGFVRPSRSARPTR